MVPDKEDGGLADLLPLLVPVVQTAPPLDPSGSAAAWPATTAITLPWNVAHQRPATESTMVHVATDGKMFYVRFDAPQHEPVIASQRSDDLITGGTNFGGGIAWSDDSVWVDFWPTGPGGFQYLFESNANGAHNEASSENTSFAPQWESKGSQTAGGYTVTMAIPLGVIHGAHAGSWRIQFVRYIRSTGELDVWSSDPAQSNPDDASRAGYANVPVVARPPLPKPRIGVYGFGDEAAKSAGGSTARFGADYSIPVSQTASIFGTVHPDYSNVELDQQSISPQVYQRVFNEVRPFFTQASGEFDNFNCNVCNGFRTTLYTFAIPTPLDGYAFEGREGEFGLGAFDAVGSGRTDDAGAFNYLSDDTHWSASVQHVAADLPGLVDDADEAGVSWYNGKYLSSYVNYATDSGTDVTDPSQGDWIDAGGGWGNQEFALFGAVRKVGSEFNPVDGFDSHPGIAGYATYSARVWTFAPQDFLSSAGASVFLDRYQGVADGQGQSDNNLLFDFLTKNTFDVQLYSGSDYWRFGPVGSSTCQISPDECPLTPISQNGGASITYHSGMQNKLNNFPTHGASATPTSISYSTGRYGDGRLDTWFRSSTLRVGGRGSVTFTDDNTAQWLQHTADNIQWFDGVSYTYQANAASSFAIGLRRVIGTPPVPNGGGDCIGACDNISVAYHLRLRQEEFYLAYGDPNTLTTVPQAIFKIIFYLGGQKGT
jgi:hypothetical protein